MRPEADWLGLVGGVLVLVLSIELVRRRHVRGRLAIAWVALGVVAVTFATFPSLLDGLTHLLRVEVPLNLVLFSGVLFLLVVSMQQAAEIGRLEARTRRLAEEVALMRVRGVASATPESRVANSDSGGNGMSPDGS